MNFHCAVNFIRERGGPLEQARLAYILDKQPVNPAITSQLLALQRSDGGWEAFWAAGYSSLDATCFRLAQAEALGVDVSHPDIARAVRFLIRRQSANGAWEESPGVLDRAPEWARPGSQQARLYLTACCGFWVAVSGLGRTGASSAAGYLQSLLTPEGRLPSFLHASWLACGLWRQLGHSEPAWKTLSYLESRLPELGSSNLAWMLTTLMVAGFEPDDPIIHKAAGCLQALQTEEGCWPGEDGPQQDVHTTLESLRVLRWMGF